MSDMSETMYAIVTNAFDPQTSRLPRVRGFVTDPEQVKITSNEKLQVLAPGTVYYLTRMSHETSHVGGVMQTRYVHGETDTFIQPPVITYPFEEIVDWEAQLLKFLETLD